MSRRDERGSAAAVAVTLVAALVLVTVLVTALGGAVADQRRVEAAADLGALAAARALQDGRSGCAAAGSVVRRNGSRLLRCATSGEVAVVSAGRRTARVLGHSFLVRSTARAGPVSGGPGQRLGGGVS